MPGRRESKPEWLRYTGIGMELAGILAGCTLLGLWIDRRFGTGPWGVLVGFGLALAVGLYNFIRTSLKAIQAANKVGTEPGAARPAGEPEGAGSHSERTSRDPDHAGPRDSSAATRAENE